MGDLRQQLEQDGYLSLNQFVTYLKLYAPEAAIAYPTARRLAESGKLQTQRTGSIYRIRRVEIERWIAEGNSPKASSSRVVPNAPIQSDPRKFPLF